MPHDPCVAGEQTQDEIDFYHELMAVKESVGWATLVVAIPTRCLQNEHGKVASAVVACYTQHAVFKTSSDDFSRGLRHTSIVVSGSRVNLMLLRGACDRGPGHRARTYVIWANHLP